jgi:alanine dehydrogenase
MARTKCPYWDYGLAILTVARVVVANTPTTWVTEDEVSSLVDVEDVIAILERAFALAHVGEAAIMPRAHVAWDGGLLHAVGAAMPGAGVAGVKTWTLTPSGARPLVVVFSTADGSLRGIVDAIALGRLRTAATAGLGTRLLAREDATTLAIVGTGHQALSQVRAVAAVRELSEVRVFGRDAARRAAFARAVRETLGLHAVEHDTVAGALRDADIVTTVTRAREPIVGGAHLEAGMHVNAVGAIVPTSRELDTDAVRRSNVVAVESLAQARNDAGDLRLAGDEGALAWDDVVELGALVNGGPGRRDESDITLLRTLGVGLADVAVAAAILDRHAAAPARGAVEATA